MKSKAKQESTVPKRRKVLPAHDAFNDEDIIKQEQKFIDYYMASEGKGSVRILIQLYRGHVGGLLLSCIFYLLKESPTWIIPIVTAQVIDLIANGGTDAMLQIVIRLGALSVLVLQNYFTTRWHTKYLSVANRSVEATLRGAIVRKLQRLSINFHKEMEAGRIQSKIMRDVDAVGSLLSNVVSSLLGFLVNLVVAVSVVLVKNPIMLAPLLGCAAASALIQRIYRAKMKNSNYQLRKEVENTSADVIDMVHLLPVTKAHALEHLEINKMTHRMGSIARKGYEFNMVNASFGALNWVMFTLFQLACLAVSCYMAFHHYISIGDVTLYQSYFGTLVSSISSIIILLPMITSGMESVRSIGEILSAHNTEDDSGKRRLPKVEGSFEFRDVHFSYDERTPVLKGLDLKVNAGETIALVGESGSGKSTVLNMIIGFHFPDSGALLLDNQPIESINLHDYRAKLAVVPQTSILFSGTIRENITYGMPKVSQQRLQKVLEDARLTELINSLPDGLDTLVGEQGGKLSGGQRQRISIARAMLRDPKVIIFDEATSALDSQTERHIQEAVENLSKGRTTFLVAHRLSTIRNADHIAVIKDGKCAEFGTYEELMKKKGEFYHYKQLQS